MGKKIRKWLSIALAVVLLASALPLIAGAIAPSIGESTQSASTSGGPLKVEIKSNKDKYTLLGKMTFTATITNTSSSTVENISAVALFGNSLRPLNGSTLTANKANLAANESFSFTYYADLKGLKSLDNLLLPLFWCSSILHGSKADAPNSNGGAEYIEESKAVGLVSLFSKQYDASTSVRVWHETGYTDLIEKEYEMAEKLETLTSSADYLALSETEKKNVLESALNSFAKDGVIKEIHYNFSAKSFEYEYVAGGLGGWDIIEDTHEHDNKPGLNFSNFERLSSQYQQSISSQSALSSVILYDWYELNSTDEKAIEMQEYFYCVKDLLVENGFSSLFVNSPTVDCFKTNLKDKNFIALAVHGAEYRNQPVLSLHERDTSDKRTKYKEDIDENRIARRNNRFTILPKFFEEHYKGNQLDDSIVFLATCSSFGKESVFNYDLVESFLNDRGASTVVGFHNSVNMKYGAGILGVFLEELLKGKTTLEAFNYAKAIFGNNDIDHRDASHPNPGIPCIRGKTDKRLVDDAVQQLGEYTATVKDDTLAGGINPPLAGVNAKAINAANSVLVELITDTTGKVHFKLPEGEYTIVYSKEGYRTVSSTETISRDEPIVYDAIWLTRLSGDFATITGKVLEQGTSTPLSGVLVQATKTGSTAVVDSATTSANGGYLLMVEPNITYNLRFTKTGYAEQTLSNVNVGNALALDDVLLTKLDTGNPFAGGTGTATDPFLISTPAQLNNMRNDLSANYKLINDVDLASWGDWEPIGSSWPNDFSGVFDGNGYVIRNMTVNVNNKSYAGLFGCIDSRNAAIKNIGIVNSTVNLLSSGGTGVYAGAVVGYFNGSLISNCYNTGTVSAIATNSVSIGGIAGHSSAYRLFDCYNTGRISGTSGDNYWDDSRVYAGGITGINISNLSNCYNMGEISATSSARAATANGNNAYAGGIVGVSSLATTMSNSYNTGTISATSIVGDAYKGGIAGHFAYTIDNTYFLGSGAINAVGDNTGILTNVHALTEVQLRQQSSFVGFDFTNVWTINPAINNGYPYLRGMQP